MKFKKSTLATALAAVTGLAISSGAQAVAVISMTIEDVGSTLNGVNGGGAGTYSAATDGNAGGFRFANINASTYTGVTTFVSSPVSDMKWDGTAQAPYDYDGGLGGPNASAMTTGFIFAGTPFEPMLTAGGATADVSPGSLSISALNWAGYYQGASFQFNMPPDAGTIAVNWVVAAGGGDYKVSFQWEHYITSTDDPSGTYAGLTARWILEGTMHTTAVPVPAAAYLFGSGLIGLAGVARRRRDKKTEG